MYHFTESGLDYVWLKNGYREAHGLHGPMIAVSHSDMLHELIAQAVVDLARPLQNAEIRYLRHHMSLSRSALAESLGVSELALAQWEMGKAVIPFAPDKLLRLMIRAKGNARVTLRRAMHTVNWDMQTTPKPARLVFEETRSRWSTAE